MSQIFQPTRFQLVLSFASMKRYHSEPIYCNQNQNAHWHSGGMLICFSPYIMTHIPSQLGDSSYSSSAACCEKQQNAFLAINCFFKNS